MSAEQKSSNRHLLYSERIKTNKAKHVVQLIESKNKEKPTMRYTKSSVLSKVLDLLPRMKEGEAELKTKGENELNMEMCDENGPAIEMNVAIPKVFQGNDAEVNTENSNDASSEREEESEESNGEDESGSDDDSSGSEESVEEEMLSSHTQRTLQQGQGSSADVHIKEEKDQSPILIENSAISMDATLPTSAAPSRSFATNVRSREANAFRKLAGVLAEEERMREMVYEEECALRMELIKSQNRRDMELHAMEREHLRAKLRHTEELNELKMRSRDAKLVYEKIINIIKK